MVYLSQWRLRPGKSSYFLYQKSALRDAFFRPLHEELYPVIEEAAAVGQDDETADSVDEEQHSRSEAASEKGDEEGEACEPQAGSGHDTGHEIEGVTAAHGSLEGAQQHGAVQDGLGIGPGDDAGIRYGFPQRMGLDVCFHFRPTPQKTDTDVHDQKASYPKDGTFQQGEEGHEAADAEEAGKGEGYVKENDDEGGKKGFLKGRGSGCVDDEHILHADGGRIGQSQKKSLQDEIHR